MKTKTPFFKGQPGTIPAVRDFKPVRVLEIEIGQPLPDISAVDATTGQTHERALALVRLHSCPLGMVNLRLEEHGLGAAKCARQIWSSLSSEVNIHLQQDGIPQVATMEAAGLSSCSKPKCIQNRETLLSNAPFVSIIVATRNRPEKLATCLSSLLALDYPNYEIIVVDNAPSTNATHDLIRRVYGDCAQVRYVREDRPGIAVAHNRGLLEVKAPIVAFTDDDVVIDRCWLAELVSGFYAAENVACVTGMIVPAELQTTAQVWFEQFGGFTKGFTRLVFDLSENRPKSLLYPYTAGMFGSGANMAFKTFFLSDVGGFDPALGAGSASLGGDDLAAFIQVITRGYRLVYQPAAIVHHRHRRDYRGLTKQIYGYGLGLAAYLTSVLVNQPSLFFDFVARIPYGLVYTLSPRSPKNRKKLADYPRELTNIELKGMLYGPFAYLRSCWQSRKMRKQVGPLERSAIVPVSPAPLADKAP